MNRRSAVLVFMAGMVVGGLGLTLWRRSPEPAKPTPQPAATSTTSPAAPVVREAPLAATPAGPPEGARRSERRAPASASRPPPAAAVAAADVGTLHIDSDIAGAQVFIDREYIGATPVTAEKVKAGLHRLNVSAQGYDGVAETIDVAPGSRDIVIKFKEVKLDAAIDVVHKHRMGSCRGRLIATTNGLRYETANKDDAFSGALMDLEAFQVDYLQKDLRVKLRQGRRYEFTDPEGNADRLFVFQRDVQKAIDRLKKGDSPASR